MIRLDARKKKWLLVWLLIAGALGMWSLSPKQAHAICATVKIEIQQELTLERQAFDAHMRINNGLSAIPIENVGVTVNFSDEAGNPVVATSDPNDTGALFYIRIDSMDEIDSVNGTGSVAPETSADIHWLIIPAPGASNGLESGALYYVGATLTYTVSGETETIDVSPDYIFVKPMPQLVLDYFLPTDVYGDDAHTTTIEPPVPFNLGLRVSNKGDGYARSLKIDSAQPEIVGNESGLLIGFQIDGSRVNGMPATDSLLADFGDIAPHSAGTARWIMSCSLSGQFVSFGAQFSHADELGGQLTSLIAEGDVNTHFLVRDVLVDAEGRDAVEDFLAQDNDVLRVYESDNTETVVTDQSSSAALAQQSGNTCQLTTPPTSGFMYARLTDPFDGAMAIQQVIRSDGKQIKPANAWLSKTRTGSDPWQYLVSIFDHNSPGSYTIVFQSPADIPQAPVIAYIPGRSRVEGVQLSFLVEASDPNGTLPVISARSLPIGATFTDQGDGTGIFDWTPAVGQAGAYVVGFIASDGALESSRQAVITVLSADDADGDGMRDSWETDHFGNGDRDGSGDFDGDGISDLDEYLNGLDPTVSDSAPSAPEIIYPRIDGEVDQLIPALEILNSVDPEGDAFTYTFEIYTDDAYSERVASQNDVAPQVETTQWDVTVALEENTSYFWRVKAQDQTGSSNWAYGRFFVNTRNDAPTPPGVGYPADGTSVDTTTPTLEITNAADPDRENLTYTFEVFADIDMTIPVVSSSDIPGVESGRTAWRVAAALDDNTGYYWRAVAVDGSGAQTPGPLSFFQVDTLNGAPGIPAIREPGEGAEITYTQAALVVTNAQDPDGDALTYIFEIDTVATFDGPDKVSSGPVPPGGGTTQWVATELRDDTIYHWRAKAFDGGAESPWVVGRFFVNTVNNPPTAPGLRNPADDAWVGTLTPDLSLHGVSDPDGDALSYRFEIYTDPDLTEPSGYTEISSPVWSGMEALESSRRYYWRTQAVDEHGVVGDWSETGTFFVKLNSVDLPPQFYFIDPSGAVATNAQTFTLRWSDADPDSNARIALYYDDDAVGADGVLIVENLEEDQDGAGDSYAWDIGSLEGAFFVYAVIDDGVNPPVTRYSPGPVSVSHAASAFSLTVDDGASPLAGARVYVCNTAGDDLGMSGATDANGNVSFTLLHNDYRFRVDHLGHQFWSSDYRVPDASSGTFSIPHQDITITVQSAFLGKYVDVIKGAMVQLYAVDGGVSAIGDTGLTAITDSNGQVVFRLPDKPYRVDACYLNYCIESDDFQSQDTSVAIRIGKAFVFVSKDRRFLAGIPVHLCDGSGNYMGVSYTTSDVPGQPYFLIPPGDYSFRADVDGLQYWSEQKEVIADSSIYEGFYISDQTPSVTLSASPEVIDAGESSTLTWSTANADTVSIEPGIGSVGADGSITVSPTATTIYTITATKDGERVSTNAVVTVHSETPGNYLFTLTVDDGQAPLPDVRVYVYDTATGLLLDMNGTTDADGSVSFTLPDGDYEFRVDHLGHRFWSADFSVPEELNDTLSIPHQDITITVQRDFPAVAGIEGAKVRMIADGGTLSTSAGLAATTDSNGQVVFRLPDMPFSVGVSYLGLSTNYPSHPQDTTVTMAFGAADVLVNMDGNPLAGIPVHLCNSSGNYMGVSETTAADGHASFPLPRGASYYFQAEVDGLQYRSSDLALIEVDKYIPVSISITDESPWVSLSASPEVINPGDSAILSWSSANADTVSIDPGIGSVGAEGSITVSPTATTTYTITATKDGERVSTNAVVTVHSENPGSSLFSLTVDEMEAPLPGARVYVHDTATGLLLEMNGVTDADGSVSFTLPDGDYRFRVDYLGHHFWSADYRVPDALNGTLSIAYGGAEVLVTRDGSPLAGVPVYACYNNKECYDVGEATGADGRALLPQLFCTVEYQFLADVDGAQYWSDPASIEEGGYTPVSISITDESPWVSLSASPEVINPGESNFLKLSVTNVKTMELIEVKPGEQVTLIVIGTGGQDYFCHFEVSPITTTTYTLKAEGYNGQVAWATAVVTVNTAPTITLIEPDGVDDQADQSIAISWEDDDPDDNATIALYYDTDDSGEDGTLIVQGLFEDEDLAGDSYLWDTSTVSNGDYYIYAVIDDGVHPPVTRYSSGPVSVIHTASDFSLTVDDGASPLAGARVYVCNTAGEFLNMDGTTDANGSVSFNLIYNDYRFRVDHMGHQFWSADFSVPGALSGTFSIPHQDIVVTVLGDLPDVSGIEGAGVELYAVDGGVVDSGDTGIAAITDGNGRVVFRLPDKLYRVNTCYLNTCIESDDFQSRDTTVIFELGVFELTVYRDENRLAGVPVHLYDGSGNYMGLSETTYIPGKAFFPIPPGDYSFRVDVDGLQYWGDKKVYNESYSVCGNDNSNFYIDDQTASVTFSASPEVIDAGESSTLTWSTANADTVSIDPGIGSVGADGSITVSPPATTTYTITATKDGERVSTTAVVTVHPENPGRSLFSLTVDEGDAPVTGARVYVHDTATGLLLDMNGVTDADGSVSFTLADGDYRFRVDYLGHHFRSADYRVPDALNGTLSLAYGEAEVLVTGDGTPLAGVPVYACNHNKECYEVSETTGADGRALLPQLYSTAEYQFRADVDGPQYWSGLSSIEEGGDIPVSISITDESPWVSCSASPEVINPGETTMLTCSTTNVEVIKLHQENVYWCTMEQTAWTSLSPTTTTTYTIKAKGTNGEVVWATAVVTVNTAPTITLIEPDGVDDQADESIAISWEDDDPDNNATIALYYDTDNSGEDGTLIVQGLFEDEDLAGDSYLWDTSTVVDGDYYIYAVIDDGLAPPVTRYSPGVVNVRHGATQNISSLAVDAGASPLADTRVYACSTAGDYMGTNSITDAGGRMFFNLRDGDYRIRADIRRHPALEPGRYRPGRPNGHHGSGFGPIGGNRFLPPNQRTADKRIRKR